MKTKKRLIRVLNTCAVILAAGVISASIMNFLGLSESIKTTDSLALKHDAAFNAWFVNFCLALPVVLALTASTLKTELKELVWSVSFLLGFIATGYYSSVLIGICIAQGAYIKTFVWLLVTINIIFFILLLIRCLAILKDDVLNKFAPKKPAQT